METTRRRQTDLARHWSLDPRVTFLNHGSFGACPDVVLNAQTDWRRAMEKQPVRFLARKMERELDRVRVELGRFLSADPDGLALLPNATQGVNTVLRSLPFEAGDEVVFTDQGYNACNNAVRFLAERTGLRPVVAPLPFPIASEDVVVESVLAAVTPRTRLVMIDAVTSPTALVLPFARIVRELTERGVDTLIDGAHAPGMLDLNLDELGAAYFTGNCHKWMCTPKGSAFLWVREDRRDRIRPLSISHGYNSRRTDRSRFRLEFDWTGTVDPSAYLVIPEAITFFTNLLAGGWTEYRERIHALVLEGRRIVGEALGVEASCPASMIGSIASFPLTAEPDAVTVPPLHLDPRQVALLERHRIEVPIMGWGDAGRKCLRISANVYNKVEDYEHLASALKDIGAVGAR